MRRIILFCILILLLFVSCSTMVSIPYIEPSVIDMGGYRNLAVASAVPYHGIIPYTSWVPWRDTFSPRFRIRSGFSPSIAASVAEYATAELYSTLSESGFFNLLSPARTDAIIERGKLGYSISEELRNLGYDAVLIPRIENMNVDEYVYAEPYEEWWTDSDGKRHRHIEYEYYYNTETGAIVTKRTFADSRYRESSFDPVWGILADPGYLFRRMLSSFDEGILRQFVPRTRLYDITLMKNKPKNDDAKIAYDYAKDGNLSAALDGFLSVWENDRHLPSGYNAALLIASTGDYDRALELLQDIQTSYSNEDVRSFYRDLITIRSRNEEGLGQISGETSATPVDGAEDNAIYFALLD